MTAKTFAYQLGEVRGSEWARAAHIDGADAADPAACAATAIGPQYASTDPEHGDFVAGFVSAWTRWFDVPEFMRGAPIEPHAIVTQPALRTALEAALPNVNQLGFHDQLAAFLVEHITRMPDPNTSR